MRIPTAVSLILAVSRLNDANLCTIAENTRLTTDKLNETIVLDSGTVFVKLSDFLRKPITTSGTEGDAISDEVLNRYEAIHHAKRLANEAKIAKSLGDNRRALKCLEQSLKHWSILEDQRAIASCLQGMGALSIILSEYTSALEQLRLARSIFLRLNDIEAVKQNDLFIALVQDCISEGHTG